MTRSVPVKVDVPHLLTTPPGTEARAGGEPREGVLQLRNRRARSARGRGDPRGQSRESALHITATPLSVDRSGRKLWYAAQACSTRLRWRES